jgi:hypothetical protein
MGFGEMERLAVSIAKSNMFGMKTPEQALVLMAIAQAEGRHPALAARDYDVIQGRPSKKAEAMLRDFLEGGGKVVWNALDDTIADATFSHPQGGSARISWDLQRAATAGLGGKDNWKKFPRQMLRSRVVSEGVRTVWPMATSGLYVPEEAADMPAKEPHNGPTIDHETPVVPMRAAAASMPRAERVADPTVYDAPSQLKPQRAPADRTDQQWQTWLDKLRDACAVLYHRQEVIEVSERASVGDAMATGPEWVRREISSILAENFKRFGEDDPMENEEPEVEIAGSEKAASG